jgi:hypothetical protein
MKAFRSAEANQPKQKGKKEKGGRRRHENKEKPGQTRLPIRAHALLLQPRRNELGMGFPLVPAELVVREVCVLRDEREQPHAAVL